MAIAIFGWIFGEDLWPSKRRCWIVLAGHGIMLVRPYSIAQLKACFVFWYKNYKPTGCYSIMEMSNHFCHNCCNHTHIKPLNYVSIGCIFVFYNIASPDCSATLTSIVIKSKKRLQNITIFEKWDLEMKESWDTVWALNLTRLQLNLRQGYQKYKNNADRISSYYKTCQEAQSLNKRVMQCVYLPWLGLEGEEFNKECEESWAESMRPADCLPVHSYDQIRRWEKKWLLSKFCRKCCILLTFSNNFSSFEQKNNNNIQLQSDWLTLQVSEQQSGKQ